MEEVLEVRSVRDVRSAIGELRRRQAEGEPIHPFCCAVLHTGERGLDGLVADYVAEEIDILDGMTGSYCLVFVLDVESGGRSRSAAEVYGMADMLRVRVDAFPCLVFFTDPSHYEKTLVLRLAAYLPRRDSRYDPDDLATAFKGVAAATRECADVPQEARLEYLREELTRIYERDFQPSVDQAQRGATRLEWVTVGTSVLQALTGGLALAVGGT